MTTPVIYGLSPCKLNSAVLAIDRLQLPPDIAADSFRHSGNEFASAIVVPGASPRVRFQTPFYDAYSLIGLKGLKLTTFEVYFAKFVDSLRTTSNARKYSLTSSCTAFAYIRSASVGQRGIVMAEIEVVPLSNTGMAHPLTAADDGAVPAVSAQPTLHTLGPATINGTTVGGFNNFSLDLGQNVEAPAGDGDLYARVCAWMGGDPVISVEHSDPVTLGTTLGLTGAALTSNYIQYLRSYDSTNHITLSTGLSLTIASGRVIPEEFGADNQGVSRGGLRVSALSTSSTHPIVIATGATVPVP